MAHTLRCEGHVDPFLVALCRRAPQEGIAVSPTRVQVGETILVTIDDSSFDVGEHVTITLYGNFYGETKKEEEIRKKALLDRLLEVQTNEKERTEKRLEEARNFNASLAIPFAYTVGIKAVLSGLSERSWGAGTNRATVYHIVVQEPLVGRLKRATGDFLCSSSPDQNGKRWVDPTNRYQKEQEPKITCKACITIAERLKKKGK